MHCVNVGVQHNAVSIQAFMPIKSKRLMQGINDVIIELCIYYYYYYYYFICGFPSLHHGGWGSRPPDKEVSCEYIEQAVVDSRQGGVLQLGGLA